MAVGLIGTGNMGTQVGRKLLKAGEELVVFDLRAAATHEICLAGANRSRSLSELAHSVTTVVTSLPNHHAVESVMLGERDGLLRALAPGSTIIDISTSSPALASNIGALAAELGHHYLDAPLIRGGEIIVAGGTPSAFERSQSLLTILSQRLFHVGSAGMGQAMKLVRQYVAFSYFLAEAEGLLIAKKAGVDIGLAVEILGLSVGPTQFRTDYWDAVFRRDFGDPGHTVSTLNIVAKDIGLAVGMAQRLQTPAVTGLGLLDILQRGLARDFGSNGFWSAVRVLEQMAGVELRRNTES